jgi:hypothetical protein
LATCVWAGVCAPVAAQSTDRDNPTPLKTADITGVIEPKRQSDDAYYTFVAGPGTVRVMLSVTAKRGVVDSAFVDGTMVLFDPDGDRIDSTYVQSFGSTEQQQAGFTVKVAMPVVLRITVKDHNGSGGSYRIRVTGDVNFSKGSGAAGNSTEVTTTPTSSDAASGPRLPTLPMGLEPSGIAVTAFGATLSEPPAAGLPLVKQAKAAGGVVVRSVVDRGPAWMAGLRANDVIVEIDEQPVQSLTSALAALLKGRANDAIFFTVNRGEKSLVLTLRPSTK